ncbi:nucleotidyltransferase domain-containing protein [Thermococcus sp. JCM 11816]|uniref:nucleotidyltransferase domain-containing protein n=1 Tax=Thermococcus sp. (strain JCM 11816 / KS-1) TaxID=1295125 RepID=UPI0006D21007
MRDIIRKAIVETAEELGVEVKEIILFGSRARGGDFRKDSDWDVLVVTKERIPRHVELELYKLVHRKLLFNGIKADILIISKDELEKVKDNKAYVYYYALKEGIKV